MISGHTTAEIFRKLREDPENRTCFDCNDIDLTYASVNLGIMLCSKCASQHCQLGINISHVKSLKEPWTTWHLKLMTAGGNTSLKTFFAMYSIPLNAPDKYKTVACEYYREMIKMMADGDRIMMLTPSEEEGPMLMEEFREPEPIIISNEERDPSPENQTRNIPNPENPSSNSNFSNLSQIRKIGKLAESETFTAIKGITSEAFDFFGRGVKWGAEKGIEGLEWSAQQGKKLIRKMSNRESLIEEAHQVYSKLHNNLNFAKIKEETLKMIREIEEKSMKHD